jgi:hypothetical protein
MTRKNNLAIGKIAKDVAGAVGTLVLVAVWGVLLAELWWGWFA